MDIKDTLLIFDCDGVLVDSEVIACNIRAMQISKLGYPITGEEYLLRFSGRNNEENKREVEQLLGRSIPNDYNEAFLSKLFKTYHKELSPIEGIESILAVLKNKCVASNTQKNRLHTTLHTANLLAYFEQDYLFSVDMVAKGKPAPDLFLLAAQKMGYPPEKCLVIEDGIAGIQAAIRADMKVIAFTGGSHIKYDYQRQRLIEAGATTVFSNMRELYNLLGLDKQ